MRGRGKLVLKSRPAVLLLDSAGELTRLYAKGARLARGFFFFFPLLFGLWPLEKKAIFVTLRIRHFGLMESNDNTPSRIFFINLRKHHTAYHEKRISGENQKK